IVYKDANGATLSLTQAQINAIEGAFSVASESGTTTNGAVDGSFSLADGEFACLTHGQTITLTETVTVDDHHGGTDTSTETVTILGPNHPPVFTSAPETVTILENQSLQPPTNLVTDGGFETYSYDSSSNTYTFSGWSFSNFLYPP